MAEVFMTGPRGDRITNESNEHYVPCKEIFVHRSPRSPLSSHIPDSGSIDLSIYGVVGNSIEQLCHNVCDMQSSDQSPSRYSMLSYGQESRIDSELRFLALGENGDVETRKEVVKVNNEAVANITPAEEEVGQQIDEIGKIEKTSVEHGDSLSLPFVKSKVSLNSSSSKSNDRPPNKKSLKNLKKSNGSEKSSPLGLVRKGLQVSSDGEYHGTYLLKKTKDLISSGENPKKVMDFALRAKRSFESCANEKLNLDYVMCLHAVAALYCSMAQHNEAIPLLERSIEIPMIDEGQNHALAKFSGCMQLGDTYAILGQIENSIVWYTSGLEIQSQVLGEKDIRFGETCRYVAEAYVQNLQFDEAGKLCQKALDIHHQNGSPDSLEEAADRRLMGLIYECKEDYTNALEHYELASRFMAANGQETEEASISCNIGDIYLSLARYEEAVSAYQKALTVFKLNKGENHPSVASVFIRFANLYNKIGMFRKSKSYCENAIKFYLKPTTDSHPEQIASGLIEVSATYESMNELGQALNLLHKALDIYYGKVGQQSTLAGIEAQMGALYYMIESYSDSYKYFKRAISNFRSTGEKKSALFAVVLNQMGLACVHLQMINKAADVFEEARSILEVEYGQYHPYTLGVYINLAGTYDAMGRSDDAIGILEHVLKMREEKLGTVNLEADNEKMWLSALLKEAGIARKKKSRSLEPFLDISSPLVQEDEIFEL